MDVRKYTCAHRLQSYRGQVFRFISINVTISKYKGEIPYGLFSNAFVSFFPLYIASARNAAATTATTACSGSDAADTVCPFLAFLVFLFVARCARYYREAIYEAL
jgi:hypothetical protein